MDAGRRHKTPESETKRTVYLFIAIAVACIPAFVPVLGAPVPTGKHKEVQVTATHAMGCITEKEHWP